MTTITDPAPVWQLQDLSDEVLGETDDDASAEAATTNAAASGPAAPSGSAAASGPATEIGPAAETGPAVGLAAHATEATRAATSAATPAASRARMPAGTRRSGSTNLLLAVSALIALGGIGFAVGRATSAAQVGTTQSTIAVGGNSGFVGGAGSAAAGAATLSGTVVSVAADSFTLQLANGQTIQVATGPSTTYHGQASATGTDVTTGATVTVKTTSGAAAGSSAGTSAVASPGAVAGARTATDVTITTK